jgi:hypothetical protein
MTIKVQVYYLRAKSDGVSVWMTCWYSHRMTVPSRAEPSGRIRGDETPRGESLVAHVVEHPENVAWIEIAPGIELPERFVYREEPKGGELRATLHMRVIDGRVACERLELEPWTDPTGRHTALTRVAVQNVPVGRLLRDAPVKRARVTLLQPEPENPNEAYRERQRLVVAMLAKQRGEEDPVRAATRPRGPREPIPMDDQDLERVAEMYRVAVDMGQAPTAKIMAAHHVSRSTASRWVRRARDRGLLDEARA